MGILFLFERVCDMVALTTPFKGQLKSRAILQLRYESHRHNSVISSFWSNAFSHSCATFELLKSNSGV